MLETLPNAEAEQLDLGAAVGHCQAFGMMAGRCTAAQAAALKRLRDSRAYHQWEPLWRDFCRRYLHMSGARADNIIRAYEQFGDAFFEILQYARISPVSYRALQPYLKDGALEIEGERIEFTPANSDRIRNAVDTVRARKPKAPPPQVDVADQLWEFRDRAERLILDYYALAEAAHRENLRNLYLDGLEYLSERITDLRDQCDVFTNLG